jgi:hypothetical protein
MLQNKSFRLKEASPVLKGGNNRFRRVIILTCVVPDTIETDALLTLFRRKIAFAEK